MLSKATLAGRVAIAVAATTVAGLAAAQTQTDIHRDAATRNTGGDAFMIQNSRAFYCNLADNNNGIVLQARTWNNTTGLPTTFGQNTDNEMCYSFTAYYPKLDSSIGWAAPATGSVFCQ